MKHAIQWHTASPLWPLSLQDSGPAPKRFFEPAVLSFAGDTFMEEFQQALAEHPERIAEHVARKETWRTAKLDRAGWVSEAQLAQAEDLKLYHPVHNRYYLATANLVCRTHGLPDRRVDVAAEERAAFVMRRLVPLAAAEVFDPDNEATYEEFGWFGDRQQGVWARVAAREQVVSGEERLALFPITFDQNERKRRVLSGMIPVGSREMYEAGAPQLPTEATAGEFLSDIRLVAFWESVIVGFEQLRDLPPDLSVSAADNDEARLTLGMVLLDFADFLSRELPRVWNAVDTGSGSALKGAEKALYDFLLSFNVVNGNDWSDLIDNAHENRNDLLQGNLTAAMLFNAAGFGRTAIQLRAGALLVLNAGGAAGDYRLVSRMTAALDDPRKAEWRDVVEANLAPLEQSPVYYDDARSREAMLTALLPLNEFLQLELPELGKAIESGSSAGLGASERAVYDLLNGRKLKNASWRELLADAEKNRSQILSEEFPAALLVNRNQVTKAEVEAFAVDFRSSGIDLLIDAAFDGDPLPGAPRVTSAGPVFYKLRFVYERPRCGRAVKPVVSKPSRAFQLAAFFDSEAPVRQISIEMPADTSIAGLRDFPKNFSIKMSDELRKQMARAQSAGMQGLIDGEVPEGQLPNLGMICSFSIPIITICALILLMIIVQLLNIVFWWLPLFRICLPLPLKSKG